ncbi:hypothetical protein BC938DRAFT_472093 [Jimgerdemannia flammicorona]|uniref:Kinase n=1 Tax=Jimgerdemannia flammicorona TaxID=994334 RepID=A0A433QU68_9FUNG|nr:hypothetical protein BC938DRAFT_472093 [Jimgerdemannia flammicorona]
MDPPLSTLKRFDHQVAGHDSLLQHPTSDLLVVKPCSVIEREFYESARTRPEVAEWLPEFFGYLRIASDEEKRLLGRKVKAEETEDGVVGKKIVGMSLNLTGPDDILCVILNLRSHRALVMQPSRITSLNKPLQTHYICLENIVHGFKHPCVMDLKIGTRLYSDDASDNKRHRMLDKAAKTTSGSLGIRITGMKVFEPTSNSYTVYTKPFCKSFTPTTILSGFLAYLFPTSAASASIPSLDIAATSVVPVPADTDTQITARAPIPPAKKRWIMRRFVDDLEELHETVEAAHGLRMYGSSLLFVYEGDPEALECAWVAVKERQRREEEEKKEEKEEEEKDDEEEREPKIMDLKIIDFAHSKWLDESAGPDEGIVFGVGNAIKMLKRCLEEQKREKYV